MTETDMEGDWTSLMQNIDGVLSIERERVLANFTQE